MKVHKLIIWAYFVELLAAGLVTYVCVLIFGVPQMAEFSRKVSINAATMLSVAMLAASLGILGVMMQRMDSKFYRWLESKKALDNYLRAFSYVAILSVISVVTTLILSHYSSSDWLALLAFSVLVLLLINSITLIRNIVSFVRLEALFNNKIRDA